MKGRGRIGRMILSIGLPLALQADGATPPPGCAPELARCTALTAADERLACYDTFVRLGAAASQGAAAEGARSASAAADERTFGLTRHQQQAVPEGPDLLKARVVRVIEERPGNVSVLLDNGQTWAVNNADASLGAGDPVTIRRAALGSFLMTTPARHSYRVRRVR